MGDDGEQRDLTLNDLDAYTRWPYSDGQLFPAMMTAEIKFSPRCAKNCHPHYYAPLHLDEDLEIIVLTTDHWRRLQHVHTVVNAAEEAQSRLRQARCAVSHSRLSTVSMHTT